MNASVEAGSEFYATTMLTAAGACSVGQPELAAFAPFIGLGKSFYSISKRLPKLVKLFTQITSKCSRNSHRFRSTSFSGSKSVQMESGIALEKFGTLSLGRNKPCMIGTYRFSGHALDRMQDRGIPLSVIKNALKSKNIRPGHNPGELEMIDMLNKIIVVLDKATKTVITVKYGK